ncbi:uncharacterized protein [Takifugu rubripes]|uniref:uncharacterized protein n=1 Tax=Takifugu rubripes TaxID=31033 RepID=UPI001145D8C2|nr:uncharacterized protein LOC115249806 [Takifugu rubripes]
MTGGEDQHSGVALVCVAARNPSAWCTYLLCVEYAHNSLVSASTGLFAFIISLGYQPPLFEVQEDEVPSVQANIQWCRRVCRQVRAALLWASRHSQRQANRRQTPAPSYQPGQKVWLSTKDLPLQVESQKLAPHFVGPCKVEQVVNLAAVRLKLPPAFKDTPTFLVSKVKPVAELDLVLPSKPPPPPCMVDAGGRLHSPGRPPTRTRVSVPGRLGGIQSIGVLVGPPPFHRGQQSPPQLLPCPPR